MYGIRAGCYMVVTVVVKCKMLENWVCDWDRNPVVGTDWSDSKQLSHHRPFAQASSQAVS